MKLSIKTLAAIAILSISGIASAQNTASVQATANATMICPIKIQKIADLDFGNVIIGTGTAIMNNGGTLSYTGNVSPGTNDYAGHAHVASFHVSGATAFFFNITNSGNNVTVNGPGGSTLQVTLNAPNDANPIRLSYSSDGDCVGTYDFTLGGTLNVTPGVNTGSYSGAWNETVTYN